MEQTYRRALVHLYDKDLHMQLLAEREVESPGEALSIALDIFRTRRFIETCMKRPTDSLRPVGFCTTL